MACDACSGSGTFGSVGSSAGTHDARFCSHCGRPLTQTVWAAPVAYRGRLVRPRFGRMLGGVCAGIAEAYGWDPVLVRIVTVVLFCCGVVVVPLVYVAAWIIMPNAPLAYLAAPGTQGFSGSAPAA